MAKPEVFVGMNDMRRYSMAQRRLGKTIGFVPTMGYLHQGHISLVEAARARCDIVVVSIYVNPTQFAQNEDFGIYPRSTEEDLRMLHEVGCDVVFMPASLYRTTAGDGADGTMVVGATQAAHGDGHQTWVVVDQLSQGLCAKTRPHFFRGVCTVVTKLFHIVQPDAAFFGKKDYQQWRVIECMSRDLDFGIEIVGMPILREQDGLAMSSRNALLTVEHRQKAPSIHRALAEAQQAAEASPVATGVLREQISAAIGANGGQVDYVEIVNSHTLCPIETSAGQPVLIAVAALFGKVRLIDNVDFVSA